MRRLLLRAAFVAAIVAMYVLICAMDGPAELAPLYQEAPDRGDFPVR